MDFPDEWVSLGLYDDEMFELQLKYMLEDPGEDEVAKRMKTGKYGRGSEHWRCGAFYGVLDKKGLEAADELLIVAQLEDDWGLVKHMKDEINKLSANHKNEPSSVGRKE